MSRQLLSRGSSPLAHWPALLRVVTGALMAVVAVLATVALRLPDLGARFLLIYPIVLVASHLGGRHTGYSATLIATALLAGFELQRWDGGVDNWAHLATLLLFAFVGCGTAVVLSTLKRAHREAEAANRKLSTSRDEARAAREQTDLLLRELRHRVKNDIANAVALLRMQSNSSPEPARAQLGTAADRLLVLARVHERLAREGHTPIVDLQSFLGSLCTDLRTTLLGLRPISIDSQFDPIKVPSSEAVAVGLIVNELLTNALKYAFGDEGGKITVRVESSGQMIDIWVADDGCGFVQGTVRGGLGYRLVRSLTAQLHGEFACESGSEGTRCGVRYETAFVEEEAA